MSFLSRFAASAPRRFSGSSFPSTQALLASFDISVTEPNAAVFDGSGFKASGKTVSQVSPIDGSPLAKVQLGTSEDTARAVAAASNAQKEWRTLPAPVRGEVVRILGRKLRERKDDLGAMVTLEVGKIVTEGQGEVQEMIDMCDLAVGMSRQLGGSPMQSERPEHKMYESWHPLGTVGVISAFNFPVAVWSWNTAVALIAGNSVVWKPHEATPLTALACTRIAREAAIEAGVDPALFSLATGTASEVGKPLVDAPEVALVSATGSCRMGREVGVRCAELGKRSILELGGNNACIVTAKANLPLAARAVAFGAVGTAGQRCTSTRRLIVHHSVREEFVKALTAAYGKLRIGDPRDEGTLVGPLFNEASAQAFEAALAQAELQGCKILAGGGRADASDGAPAGGVYVRPALVAVPEGGADVVATETFAPILYVQSYGGKAGQSADDEVREAIALNNAVPQGLSSAIFTDSVRESEVFLSAAGSDCGLANVNIGTSGAEIGGAFGGEKETGGGREAGSDAWKGYMRRQTTTVNWGTDLPLAQGVKFDV